MLKPHCPVAHSHCVCMCVYLWFRGVQRVVHVSANVRELYDHVAHVCPAVQPAHRDPASPERPPFSPFDGHGHAILRAPSPPHSHFHAHLLPAINADVITGIAVACDNLERSGSPHSHLSPSSAGGGAAVPGAGAGTGAAAGAAAVGPAASRCVPVCLCACDETAFMRRRARFRGCVNVNRWCA